MTPSISIITPSFNQGQFVERTIQSVLSQGVDGLEYHVIDGGSSDETVSILQRYSDQLKWVSEKDRGHSEAINKGILRSTGPIIGWLNSDDIYYPQALKTVLEYFAGHPAVEVVYGDANHIDENDTFIEKYPAEPWNWERLSEHCITSQPAAFVRRAVFDRYGLMDLSLRQSMDYEFWLRLGKNGVRFEYLPRLLAATRLHKDAFTVAARVKVHTANNDLTRRHLGRTPDIWILNYAHAVVEGWGLRREQRVRFAAGLSAVSYYASLRWNKAISLNIVRTTTHWMVANARDVLEEMWRR